MSKKRNSTLADAIDRYTSESKPVGRTKAQVLAGHQDSRHFQHGLRPHSRAGHEEPGREIDNDVWCDLPEPALRIVRTTPQTKDEIFPFNPDAITAAFTRACKLLSIDDLHFHDLRHDGASRLFEMGLNRLDQLPA
jgi:hypothetical protein